MEAVAIPTKVPDGIKNCLLCIEVPEPCLVITLTRTLGPWFWVSCFHCDSRGPEAPTVELAVFGWNRLATNHA